MKRIKIIILALIVSASLQSLSEVEGIEKYVPDYHETMDYVKGPGYLMENGIKE